MGKIDKVIHNRFKANSYIFMEDDGQCIVIDCNTNTLPYLQEHNLEPVYLFVTHEHFDHVEGVKKLKEFFPNMVIVASKITSSLMKDAKTNMSFYLDGSGIIIHIGNVLFTGDTLLNIKTPTNLPNSSKKQLRESIEFIDSNFNNDTIFYQGHGDPFPKSKWDKNISIGVKK